MKDIKVLGTGCANCRNTIKLIEEVAAERGFDIALSKVEQLPEIMKYGVTSMLGVVVDGKVVHTGGYSRSCQDCGLAVIHPLRCPI